MCDTASGYWPLSHAGTIKENLTYYRRKLAEAGIGMKLGRFILLKAQYSRAEEQGPVRQGQDLGAFQLVILF